MDGNHISGANAFGWAEAWTYEDWDTHAAQFYDLTDDIRIWPGDRFWHTEERHVIEIEDVRTKVYRGVVGGQGEHGDDHVFFERDWQEPIYPEDSREVRQAKKETTFYKNVEWLKSMIEGDALVPHRGNGAPRIP